MTKNEELDNYKCGKCKWHRKEAVSGEWVCCNEISECYGCITEYNDYCEDLESREERSNNGRAD